MVSDKTRKLGFYIRVSTEKQAREVEGSLASQKQRLEGEVARRNQVPTKREKWGEIVRVYIEEGRSGKDTNRPEYQKMLQDVQNGIIDTIMVTELSRLSRSVSDFLKFMEMLTENNADFICPQYDFDTTNAAGRVFIIILMALSQFERELTGERTRSNFYARALRGLCNGGSPILGYDADPENKAKRIVNEPEAAVVRKIFKTYLETGSIQATRNAINNSGARTKVFKTKGGDFHKGQLFTRNSIHGILKNLVYLGKREVNKANKMRDQKTLKDTDRYQIVEATWPSLIEEKIFNLVQAKLAESRKEIRYDKWKVYPFLFSKRIRCLECNGEIRTSSANGRTQKYPYYRHKGQCPSNLKLLHADKVEELVLSRLRELESSEDLLQAVVRNQNELVSSRAPELRAEKLAAESEIRKTQEKIDALLDRIASLPREVDAGVLIERVKELQVRKGQLSDNIVRLESERDLIVQEKADYQDAKQAIAYVNEKLDQLSSPLRKDLIRELVPLVEIGHQEVRVSLDPYGLLAGSAVSVREKGKKKPVLGCHTLAPVCPLSNLGRPTGISLSARNHLNHNPCL